MTSVIGEEGVVAFFADSAHVIPVADNHRLAGIFF
jgi:hypothetical protein